MGARKKLAKYGPAIGNDAIPMEKLRFLGENYTEGNVAETFLSRIDALTRMLDVVGRVQGL
jgi:hypothetical protein